MQRIQYHEYGGPEVLRLEEFEPRRPGRGEVLVRIKAAAANPLDFGVRRGLMRPITGSSFPRGYGHDFSGVVAEVGPGVTAFRPGGEVFGGMYPRPSGAYAEMGVVSAKHIVHKPAGLSFEAAATIPTIGVTARQAVLDKGRLQPGQSIFVTGCLGGVGRTAVQVALAHGGVVAGSCRDSKASEARALGVDPVAGFDLDPASFTGLDVVVDAAHTLSKRDALTMLKRSGRFVDIHPTPLKMLRSLLPGRHKTLFGSWRTADLVALADAGASGEMDFPVARTVPLADAIAALHELETQGTPKGGRLVVLP
ncbi:MAG: NADP-dependent oxidoreductase [Nocardioides sp.]|nr:NADP-dependent oxidoreductase [Nocardioides sp.]